MGDVLRIMVVDDEPDLRSLHRLMLQNEYEVVEAENGLDALMKLNEYEPDLLLVDVMMPIMNGLDLAKNVRLNTHFQKIPMIFLTALGSMEDIKRGYESGANVYLTKPINLERIRKNILMFVEVENLRPRPKRLTVPQIHEREKQEALTSTEREAAREKEAKAAQAAPPAVEEPEAPRVVAPARGPARPAPRVLLVDDEPGTAENITAWLGEGFEVIATQRGIDFLRKIPRYEPDILVIGGVTPKVNGFQVLSIVRRCKALAMTPALFILGPSAQQSKYILSQGADLVMSRPVNPGELRIQMKRITSQLGFLVRTPKTLSMDQIHDQEKAEAVQGKTPEEVAEQMESEMKGKPAPPSTRPGVDTTKALREFYQKQKDKE